MKRLFFLLLFVLFIPHTSHAAITVTQVAHCNGGSNTGGTCTASVSSGHMVYTCAGFSNNGTLAFSDSAVQSYTSTLGVISKNTDQSGKCGFVNNTAAITSVTVTLGTAGFWDVDIWDVNGQDTSGTPSDGTCQNTGTNGTTNACSAGTGASGDAVLAIWSSANGSTAAVTMNNSFTLDFDFQSGSPFFSAYAHKIAAGSETPSYNITGNTQGDWIILGEAIKPAGAAVTVSPTNKQRKYESLEEDR